MNKPAQPRADALLAAIIDSSDDAIFSIDAHGNILSWNRGAERLLGYPSAEAIGLPVRALFRSDGDSPHSDVFARVRNGERVDAFETKLQSKDGRPVDVSLTLSPIRTSDDSAVAVAIARDVRDRKWLEFAPLRLAAIVASSDDAIISKDLNGIVTSWNAAAERMFGYTAEEMIGRSITTIIPTERLQEEDNVLAHIRAGLPVEHFETVRRHKHGRLIDVSLTVSPIRDGAGRIVGASKIARDITEHKRLIEAERLAAAMEEAAKRQLLEAENRRVQEANRLKGEFVANMSHELRTPLNSIIGFAELIADERLGPIGARYPEFARTMLNSAQHLLRLINDILDLAKVESGKIALEPQRVVVRDLIEDVTSIIKGIAKERKIRIAIDIDPSVDVLHLDPIRLKQVLYNYLSNAIKFSRDGGQVILRVRPEGADHFRIEVQDFGIGIRPEDFDRLFVEFQQLDATSSKKFQGTGLGLALTKRIIETQGGTVGVESEPGSGSTFFATLPRNVTARSANLAVTHARGEPFDSRSR
jgi:PAS domain S-box-containing protein